MVAPASDLPVRLRLKCSDTEDFISRFAPNVTRGGIFIPSREPRDEGAAIRFELALADERVVFAGEGVVTWAKPNGMGVKFTTLDSSSGAILERLLARREEAKGTTPEAPSAGNGLARAASDESPVEAASSARTAPASAATTPAPDVPPVAPVVVPPTSAPATVSEEAVPMPPRSEPSAAVADPKPPTISSDATRPRAWHARAWTALLIAAVLALVAVGRGRLRASSSPEPDNRVQVAEPVGASPRGDLAASTGAKGEDSPAPVPAQTAAPATDVAAPAVEPATAPPSTMPSTAATPSTATVTIPHSSGAPGALRIESVLVGPTYERFTCPNPTARFSVRAHHTVNVCLHVEHRPQPEQVSLIWEKDGAFYGKTPIELPGTRTNLRTRAHMRIGQDRLGSWSIRVVNDRNVTLAQAAFAVEP